MLRSARLNPPPCEHPKAVTVAGNSVTTKRDQPRLNLTIQPPITGVNTTKVEEAVTSFLANLKDIQETGLLLLSGSDVDGNATTFRGVHVSWTLVGTKLFCDDVLLILTDQDRTARPRP
jgi:hypothetical protein